MDRGYIAEVTPLGSTGVLQSLGKVCGDPYNSLSRADQAHGRKAVGLLPMYVPEEIIHAAGLLPLAIVEGNEPISVGNRHLMAHTCGMMRGAYDSALKGRLSAFEAVVNPLLCDQFRFFSDVWFMDTSFKHQFYLRMPYKLDSAARDFLVAELSDFLGKLEELAGRRVSPEDLRQSIRLYNEDRALMKRLYGLRKEHPGLLKAKDAVHVAASAMLMPREEHLRMVQELLEDLEREAARRATAGTRSAGSAPAGGRVRVVLAGHPCSIPDDEILDLVEDVGAQVVEDDFYFGGASIRQDLDEGLPPLEALADRYLRLTWSPEKHDPKVFSPSCAPSFRSNQADHLTSLVRESQADGIIYLREVYCDPFDFEYPFLKAGLEDAGVPLLSVRTEHEIGTLEAVRTRVQAFVEILQEQKQIPAPGR